MNTTEKLTIWARRAIPALALAATAGVMLPSCEKEKEKYDVTIPFYENNNRDNNKELFDDNIIRGYANDKQVRNIFITIVPGERFMHLAADNISSMRWFLSNKMDISPKVHGRGNFEFEPGVCTYGDSLDLVAMGFTINKQNQPF